MAAEPHRAGARTTTPPAPSKPAETTSSHLEGGLGAALVVGTAGHVDHGKTTLVRALTGMETDRLPEEQARGISIELGFAYLDVEAGRRVAIVDVPGHERFVRHMISGAAGIDAVMLVVAADEGVMPQTREHLAICRLLGVHRGFVVLTRTDLVSEEFLELAREDVEGLVHGTFLHGQPVLPFSSRATGPGSRAAIIEALSALVAQGRDRRDLADRPLLFPVDRAFSLRGHGTVVTGTSTSGCLEVGAEVVVQPGGLVARIRGLEVHGVAVPTALPGLRVAINLAGTTPAQIPRGARLVQPGGIAPTAMIDGTFEALASLPFAVPDREKALVFLGSSQVEATLVLLDRRELEPGESAPVQLRLAEPVPILPGERFVIRGFRDLGALGATLGGGVALVPAQRRRRSHSDTAGLDARAAAEPLAAVTSYLQLLGEAGLERQALDCVLPFTRTALAHAVELGVGDGGLLGAGNRLYAAAALTHLEVAIESHLVDFHARFPTRSGLRCDELRTKVRTEAPVELFAAVLERLSERGRIVTNQTEARLSSFTSNSSQRQTSLREHLAAAFEAARLTPPGLAELSSELGAPLAALEEETRALVSETRLVRVTKDLIFARRSLDELEVRIRAFFEIHDLLDPQALKELTGASRKYSIPLGEWLDRAKITVRAGEARRLRASR